MKDDLFKNNIGIIGAGHIGQALALSLLEKKYPREKLRDHAYLRQEGNGKCAKNDETNGNQ